MQLQTIIEQLENWAPPAWQESYDNAGLILGNPLEEVDSALICLDLTEKIIEEAIEKKVGLIISHHPPIFNGIKKINTAYGIGKWIKLSIENHIAWYCMHTNLDNSILGINHILAQKLNLQNTSILKGKTGLFKKVIFFCPISHSEQVKSAIFEAGGGEIGNYSHCSFQVKGEGRFYPTENASPFVGNHNTIHLEEEHKVEILFPAYKESAILRALLKAHPYEEVDYNLVAIENEQKYIGAGKIGELEKEMKLKDFFEFVQKQTHCQAIKHSKFATNKTVKKIALCGGSGSFLIPDAKNLNADIYLTGDLKYHDFEQATSNFVLADIGHYESEQFAKELIYEYISKKFPTFVVLISESCINPIHFFK